MTYDAQRTRTYFDALGEREWNRLESTLQGKVKYEVHRRLIDEHIQPGMRVLDIGSGPGRFAIDMVKLGARVTVADLSPVQVDLARRQMTAASSPADAYVEADVLDLSRFGEATFDVVVCYGGVLSYTFERHADALRELARVLKSGGLVLVSVMNLFGTLRLIGPLDAAGIAEALDDHLDMAAVMSGAGVVYTRPASTEFHQPIALFTTDGLRDALGTADFDVIDAATSNPLLPEYSAVPRIAESGRATSAMIALEVALCKEPALLDAGGHQIMVGRLRRGAGDGIDAGSGRRR